MNILPASPNVAEQFRRREEIYAKLISKIRIETESSCWLWQGPTSGNGRGGGYPRMTLNGQTVAVHRVIATHFFGLVPGKKQIDHVCRERLCVNPAHLEIVTHKQNQRRRDKARATAPTDERKQGCAY